MKDKYHKKILTWGFASLFTLMASFAVADRFINKSEGTEYLISETKTYTKMYANNLYLPPYNLVKDSSKQKREITVGVYLDEETKKTFEFYQRFFNEHPKIATKYPKIVDGLKKGIEEKTKEEIQELSEDFCKTFGVTFMINKVGFWKSDDNKQFILELYPDSKSIKRESDIVLAITSQHLHEPYSETLNKPIFIRGATELFGNNIIIKAYPGDLFIRDILKGDDLKMILADEYSHLLGADHQGNLDNPSCATIDQSGKPSWDEKTKKRIFGGKNRLFFPHWF